MNNKIFGLLGLACKAGKIKTGENAVKAAIIDGDAYLVLVATDASANTKKLFSDKCSYYEVPYFEYGTKEELGRHTGTEYRASIAVIEEGFAKSIQKKIEEEQ